MTCATLQLKSEDITDIHIENPIELGESLDNKEFVLDIKVSLNNNTMIDFELQVINYMNWPDRSLSYLCRTYDSLYHGEDYNHTKKAIHVGILDFNLFPDYPEFFAKYKLLNIKNHHIYNDKFEIRVLELNHINLATKEDKFYGLDKWATLFKAKTWEELKQLVEAYPEMENVTEQLYEYNAEKAMRDKCQARADYILHEKRTQQHLNELAKELDKKNLQLQDKDSEIAELKKQLEKLKNM